MEVDYRGVVDIASKDVEIDKFVDLVHLGIISYPYRRFYINDPDIVFEKLKNSTARIDKRRVTLQDVQTKNMPLPDEIEVFHVSGDGEELTDYYTEPQRAKASVANGLLSQYQLWMTMTKEIIMRCVTEYDRVNTYSLRTSMRDIGKNVTANVPLPDVIIEARGNMKLAPETPNFSNSGAMEIYKRFCPPGGTVLDPSAGWGDRLCGAAASGVVGEYIGIDPNETLYQGYSNIVDNHAGNMRVRILSMGSQELPYESEKSVDLVFTSPPYRDLEKYSNAATQSSNLFATSESWLNRFMYETLERTYYRLKPNRYYMLHIRDTRSDMLVSPIHEKLLSMGAKYEGLIGIITFTTVAPVWIWKKP
jgi:16S rRNA G966 N2-methylase RsmD